MLSRRTFLGSTLAGLATTSFAPAADKHPGPKKRLAVVTTLWNYRSHAWHMAERFLRGYPLRGEVASAAVRRGVAPTSIRRPKDDLSRQRAEEFGFTIYPTRRRGAALRRRQAGGRCGAAHRRARQLSDQRDRPEAVSALRVLQAGRRRLPRRTAGPRRSSTTSTCRGSGSGRRRWSTRSRELKFPFLAGSSLPVTWRMPAIDLPLRGRGRGNAVRGASAASTSTTSTPWR